MTLLYRLPEALRSDLAKPLQPVASEDEVVARIEDGTLGRPIVTVGDVVSSSLLARGIAPHLMVFDLITQRGPLEPVHKRRLIRHPVAQTEVVSPPAAISAALVNAIRDILNSPSPGKVLVQGEEDLAGLPAILHCPVGGTVIYGMPDQGLVAVPIDEAAKARAQWFLDQMRLPKPSYSR